MKRLPIFPAIALAAVASVLTSCGGGILSLSDNEVAFDSNGLVTKDVTYTYYYGSDIETDTFSSTGNYEYVDKVWDVPSSSWRQGWGSKGTYSYDTSTRLMTFNYTQLWSGGVGGSYVTLTSSSGYTKTETFPMILGSSNAYWQVLTGKDGNYTLTDNATSWNGSTYRDIMTANIASDLSMVTYTDEWENFNSGGTATSGGKSNDVMTADQIFPSSVTSLNNAKGKVITFTSLTDVSTPYTWIPGTTNFTQGAPITNHNAQSKTSSFASDGSYVAEIPGNGFNLARHLASK
jgi:hypothetical protein